MENITSVLNKRDTYIKNKNYEWGKALVEVFLSYCKNGIAICVNNNLNVTFMDSFTYEIDNDLTITDLDTENNFTIHNIEQFQIVEYDDYLLIMDDYNTIVVEELP